ncbi:Uncharacterized protein Fot_35500 [Forsythia ovata]|uniref:Uncharacterized protein n=1 Tax=Forsythia ovata TaxID=205694 RepID=A0ABD1SPQ5_9LAMI
MVGLGGYIDNNNLICYHNKDKWPKRPKDCHGLAAVRPREVLFHQLFNWPKNLQTTDCRPEGNGEHFPLCSVGIGDNYGASSVLFPTGPVSGKRKIVVDSKRETAVPGKGMEDAGDSRRARRGPDDPSSGVEDRVLHD